MKIKLLLLLTLSFSLTACSNTSYTQKLDNTNSTQAPSIKGNGSGNLTDIKEATDKDATGATTETVENMDTETVTEETIETGSPFTSITVGDMTVYLDIQPTVGDILKAFQNEGYSVNLNEYNDRVTPYNEKGLDLESGVGEDRKIIDFSYYNPYSEDMIWTDCIVHKFYYNIQILENERVPFKLLDGEYSKEELSKEVLKDYLNSHNIQYEVSGEGTSLVIYKIYDTTKMGQTIKIEYQYGSPDGQISYIEIECPQLAK